MTDSRITRGGGGGGGGGVFFPVPPRIFTGANLTACRAARDAHFSNAANLEELRQYQGNQYRAILLKPNAGNYTTETYLTGQEGRAYAAANWINRSSSAVTDAMIDARIAPYGRATPSGQIADAQIPATIARDNEITRDFLLNILGLTAQELNDLFTDAVVSGSGAARIITVTQADGSTITLAVPDTGDGGGGSADGRVASGAFAADGTTLILTLTTGGTVSIPVPSALRQAGLSQAQVQTLIDAAVADDVTLISSNTAIPATADGDTYVHTGSSNITVTLPRASGQGAVRDGYEQVISNQGAGDLTIDGHGADTVDREATLVITDLGRTVRLQKVSNSAWITIADTKDEVGTGGGGGGTPADDSLTPAMMDADTAAKMRAFRERFDSSHIGSGITLPDLATVNKDDVRVMTQDVASGLSFYDIADGSTEVTSAFAGDVIQVHLARNVKRWVRVGNILRGSAAVRALIDAADIKAAAAKVAADAAQLEADTVIEIGPEFVYEEAGPKVLGINIRHPLNAYSTATVMTVGVAGQPAVIVGYDRAHISQDTLAEVSAASMGNIWNQDDPIDDGMGGTTRVKRYPVGSYIPVEIRLLTGRGGATVFFRNVDVLVVEKVPRRFERAVGASPATLPVGTYEIAIYTRPSGNSNEEYATTRLLVSDIPSSDQRLLVRADAGNETILTMRYDPSTRQFTYSLSGQVTTSLKAIGEA